MISADPLTVKSAGEWNKARIKSNKGALTFWPNGYEVVNFKIGNRAWSELIANSKFKDVPDFGKFSSGHSCLQDHGDKVSHKNIKIKEL